MALLECIPNVSEGRDRNIINLFAETIRSQSGVKLLHVDPGLATNRTVFTFVGEPGAVLDAAFSLYEKSIELIDMSEHLGAHPRQGAVDVCPFVPLEGLDESAAVEMVDQFGRLLGSELNIPGYFYEQNATSPERVNLAVLRKGEYESLPEKFNRLPPDFGNPDNWERSGVTVIGVRKLLVAYNVNLHTKDVNAAHSIAELVRESGKVIIQNNKKTRVKGRLKSVKGLGWYIEDFRIAQVSYNLCNLTDNGMLDIFLATREEAQKLGIEVTGSELVGLAPLSEFLKAGKYFSPNAEGEDELVKAAAEGLNLNQFGTFDEKKKIIERLL